MAKKNRFTPRLELFAKEYCVDLNAYKAALRAGYSESVARSGVKRMLQMPKVKKYIESFQKKLSDKTEITAQKVIDELAKIGFSNIQDFINTCNSIKDLSTVDKSLASAVESISVQEIKAGKAKKVKTTFKLHSKIAALEQLGRHLGIFKDNLNITIKKPVVIDWTNDEPNTSVGSNNNPADKKTTGGKKAS